MIPTDCLAVLSARRYVTQIFVEGVDRNLPAFEEDIREHFEALIRAFGDDPEKCHIRGEAKWMWMRFYEKDGEGRCRWQSEAWKRSECVEVTMIRVHRN